MPSDGVQKLDQKTNLHQNGMPTVRVRTFFSQKDRNAVRLETIIYSEYLEYSEFQPYGCEQKKILRISEVEICIYIYIYWKINGTTHTYRWHIAHTYKASSTRMCIYMYIYI